MDPSTLFQRDRKWAERFMHMAQDVASWSKDPGTKVGSVLTDSDHRVISLGYNGFPAEVEDSPERLHDRELKLRITLHAEENAIHFAERIPGGSVLYTWPFQPCAHCASLIVQTRRIQRVISVPNVPPRWEKDCALAREVLAEGDIDLWIFDPAAEYLQKPSRYNLF